MHHQPAGVAAGAAGQRQCFFGRLHAGLHADRVLDGRLQLLVHIDQKVDGAARRHVHRGDVLLKQRRGRLGDQVGREFVGLRGAVLEREFLGLRLEEKVKGVEHRHLDDQINGDLELARCFRKNQPRLVVGKRVLLPVDEVAGRLDVERIRQHLGAAVRRRAQANHLRPQLDQAVVLVMRDVTQGNMNGHGKSRFLGE